MAPEELDRAVPRRLRVLGVVGAHPVVVGEERVAGSLVEVEDRLGAGLVELVLQRLRVVGWDEVVVLTEMPSTGLPASFEKSGLPCGIT